MLRRHRVISRISVPRAFFRLTPVAALSASILLGIMLLADASAGAQSIAPPVLNDLPTHVSLSTSRDALASALATLSASPQAPPAQNPPSAPAPSKPKRTIYVGPTVGVYIPTSSKTRSQFGGPWWDFGLGLGTNNVKMGGGFRPDLHVLSQAADGNRFFVGLLGVEYRKPLLFGSHRRATPPDKNGEKPNDGNGNPDTGADGSPPPARSVPYLLPYFGFSADLTVGDLRDVSEGIHSGVRTGFSGTAFLGLNVGRGFYFETRYREVTQFKGFDLSGVNFTAGYRFLLK